MPAAPEPTALPLAGWSAGPLAALLAGGFVLPIFAMAGPERLGRPPAVAAALLPRDGNRTPDEDEAGIDADLVPLAVAGDRRAFETLIRRHYDRIHRVAWRQSGSVQDAEDIAQDVLCRLVERLGDFRGEARFSTWLIGITINACRDHRRRRGGFQRMRAALTTWTGLAASPDGRDLYRRSWLTGLLGALKPDLRETVVLVIGEALSHAEAARELGISEQTVAWRMHRARKLLKQHRDTTPDPKEARDER